MKRFLLLNLLLACAFPACIWGTPTPPKTQLEIREFQTRDFDTKNQKLVIKAMLNVLQDDGFTIKSADANLGFLTATKEIDLGDSGGMGWTFGTVGPRQPVRWRKLKVIDATVNVTDFGDKTRVRVSFQEKILDNLGAVMGAQQIDDAKFYQDFFAKVDKSIFLQKEKL